MNKQPDIAKAVINMLQHLRTLPLDEVHVNIDRMIEVLQEEFQSSNQRVKK